ncbi:MFS transporter [soil metagenome]
MKADRLGILREPSFAVALVIALVVALGFGLVIPVLPLFARDFGVGLFAVTLVVSVFAGVRLVSNPYTGPLTDRIGTRRAVGWGALIVAASSLATAGAPSYWALVAFRGVGGFGSALFFNALLALVIRAVPAQKRGVAVGMLQGAFLFGIMFGPTVGGLLAQPLGLRWPFVIYAGFCGSAGLVALRFLPGHDTSAVHTEAGGAPAPRTHAPKGLRATWEAARGFSTDRAFVAALVMMAASRWAATGVRFSLVPVFGVEQIGASEAVVGLGLGLASVTHLLVVWPAGRIADTAGRRALGAPSFFAFAAVAASMGLAGTVPAFLTVLALYGLATGLTAVTPPAIVGDIVAEERTGTGVGVLNFAGDLGSVLGPLVSGSLAQVAGYGWGFGASAVLLAVGGVAALRMRETLPRAAATHP